MYPPPHLYFTVMCTKQCDAAPVANFCLARPLRKPPLSTSGPFPASRNQPLANIFLISPQEAASPQTRSSPDCDKPRSARCLITISSIQMNCGADRENTVRILVVEDEPKLARVIVTGLKAEQFAVDHAEDGEMGLELASEAGYDAMILDLGLPKLDGMTLLRRLRKQHREVPVIILSSRSSVEDRVNGLQ